MNNLIYIHGLNSSCQSNTGNLLRKEFGDHFICIDLPNNPKDWGDQLEGFFENLDKNETYTVLGSSTGGFFAKFFAEKHGYQLVLINPVVDHNDLKQLVGKSENFHTCEKWKLTEIDVDSMGIYQCKSTVPTLLFVGKNDDVLDYRKAIEIFEGKAEIIVTEDVHQFDLEPYLDDVKEMMFLTCFY